MFTLYANEGIPCLHCMLMREVPVLSMPRHTNEGKLLLSMCSGSKLTGLIDNYDSYCTRTQKQTRRGNTLLWVQGCLPLCKGYTLGLGVSTTPPFTTHTHSKNMGLGNQTGSDITPMWTDRCKKHNLPATSFAGGNHRDNILLFVY